MLNYKDVSFTYSAFVTRVVDGDTIYADVDLGFHILTKQKFRLLGIDTPEIYRPLNEKELAHGREAKRFLESLILNKFVIIQTKKTGKYGRWLADVYLDDNFIDEVSGDDWYVSVTEKMIEAGFEKRESY